MQKIRVNFRDSFSKCTKSIEKEVTKEQLQEIERIQINEIALNQFDENINYTWYIEEVELLN